MGGTKILITGATGFIGQHLIDDLSGSGHAIHVLSRKKDPEFWTTNKNFTLHQGDLAAISTLKEAMSGVEIVVNLAAELKDTSKFAETNDRGTANLLEAAKQCGVKKIIHLSSVGVVGMQYNRKPVNIKEDQVCLPGNDYERTKLQAENIIKGSSYFKERKAVILRPTNVFGEQHSFHVLLGFFRQVKNKTPFIYEKGGLVNYVYVKDLTGAIIHFINNNSAVTVVNVGQTSSFLSFYSFTCTALNVRSRIKKIPRWVFGAGELLGYFGMKSLKGKFRTLYNQVQYDDTVLRTEYNYVFGLEEGIKRTIAHYKNSGKL